MIELTRRLRVLFLCAFCFALTASSYAQVSRGTITGLVTDPAGALVAGAQIVAAETATGSQYRASSNNDGQYTIPFLAPGTYKVTVFFPGFKVTTRDGMVVAANEHVSADFSLQIGQQSETVSVSAENPSSRPPSRRLVRF
jgi:hypothetical protein